ncbi:MAG: hypothetical protein H6Q90_3761 [Deltaproteobacteria bacterium]|nr:hypothetical protein [Deltaproteobacteria bacterium]
MQVTRSLVAVAVLAIVPGRAGADDATNDATIDRRGSGDAPTDELDLRLTLSSLLYRESSGDADPFSMGGAPIEVASPVRRYFGDLRLELSGSGLAFDGRVRQTTSQRYQAGAGAGGEYEIRTLAYRLGAGLTKLVVGRQYVDAVGATKIDGAAVLRRLSKVWAATLFGGAYPALGSRSIDTDYPAIRKADGTTGAPLIPISGGLGISYNTPNVHGDLGAAAVFVAQDVPDAVAGAVADGTSAGRSRVFTTASGYARPAAWLDCYHFALLDLAGGVHLTNGSAGINAHPMANLQLSAAVNHVSTDLLQIAARNVLSDPDPTAIGVVQNDISVIRVSQDSVRGGTSVALHHARFELSLSGGYHRRPGVAITQPDGAQVTFPAARSADTTLAVLDRKSIAGMRVSASASLTFPIGNEVPNRARGGVVRLAAMRTFLDSRAELTADLMLERFRDAASAKPCTDSLDVFACFSTSTTGGGQGGVLGSYRVAREWLVLLDTHIGLRDVHTSSVMGTIGWPRVFSLTAFARVQWRYR